MAIYPEMKSMYLKYRRELAEKYLENVDPTPENYEDLPEAELPKRAETAPQKLPMRAVDLVDVVYDVVARSAMPLQLKEILLRVKEVLPDLPYLPPKRELTTHHIKYALKSLRSFKKVQVLHADNSIYLYFAPKK